MYQVLARKWRPKNFKELVGQHHVTQALTYALEHQLLHHAYLFTGTRGVGKTTIARIFAKSLNCQTNGVSAEPCGNCDHCREIDAGRFPDLIEVDAASRTQVDDTRQLLANVPYAPVKGRYKVYLIDEVHMFSEASFNALLKTLEEPPEHVKFILATTDPQKVPTTVLSRCLQFQLKNMTALQIAEHLQAVLQGESIAFEAEAIALLAEAAQGSMRDSLSLLDQAIAYGQGSVCTKDVANLLGAVPAVKIRELFTELANGDAKALRTTLASFEEFSPDHMDVLRRILQGLQHITIAQLDAQRTPNEIDAELVKIALRLPMELVQLWYQIATDAWQSLPYQPDIAVALEMTLLRMLALQPILPEQSLEQVRAIPAVLPEAPPATDIIQTLAKEFAEEDAIAESSTSVASQTSPPAAATSTQATASAAETTSLPESQPASITEPPPWVSEVPPADDEFVANEPAENSLTQAEIPSSVVAAPTEAPSVAMPASSSDQPSDQPSAQSMASAPSSERSQSQHDSLRRALQATIGKPEAWAAFAREHFAAANFNQLFSDNIYPIGYQDNSITLALDEIGMAWWDDAKRRQFEYEFSLLLGENLHVQINPNTVTNTHYYAKQRADSAEQARAITAFSTHPVVVKLQQEFAASIEQETILSLKTQE